MKIAVAQIGCALGDPPANLAKIQSFCERAATAGAELIVFPEMVDTGYAMATIRQHAQAWDGGTVPALREIARNLSLGLVCGVSERADGCIFNTQVFINSAGEVAARYRKTHLFSPPPIEEHTCFTAGGELATIEHAGFRFGFSICYDLRFPELYRALALEHESQVFLLSSAWPFPRVEHLRLLATARAVENQSYLHSRQPRRHR